MILDSNFVKSARDAFPPFTPFSGTEHVAPLLYSIARLTKPKVAVEYGSGYTTLFLLAALAENAADFQAEASLLREKTAALGDLARLDATSAGAVIEDWFGKGDRACGADPAYYLQNNRPHLYSFEEQDRDHEYTQRMKGVVDSLHLTEWLSYLNGTKFSIDLLPKEALPIDLAWNDSQAYKEFFEAAWPALNPKGGLMIFHNTVSRDYSWDAIQWMKAKRSLAKDLELITFPEPHKLDQSSCTILRRTSQYQPPCLTRHPEDILQNAIKFMAKRSDEP